MSNENREMIQPMWIGVGRAVGGSLIFSLPIMMTMEMWSIGAYIDPIRLIALILFSIPLFYRISIMIGFRSTKTFWDNLIDVLVAYIIAFITTGVVLLILGVISTDTQIGTIYSILLLQSVPGSLGALLARNTVSLQDSSDVSEQDTQTSSHGRKDKSNNYRDDLAVFAAGSLFLAFNLAPTEEMELISHMMTPVHTLLLLILTLVVMHAFSVASSNMFSPGITQWSTQLKIFIRLTSVGYLIAILISIFMLWIFGNPQDYDFFNQVKRVIVLGFPAGIGAAASRMIL